MTRPNLRTTVQSIARHDSEFPQIADYRSMKNSFLSTAELEGGAMISDLKQSHLASEMRESKSPKVIDHDPLAEIGK